MTDLQEPTYRRETLSREEVLSLPVTVDVPTAGRCFGLARDTAYRRARDGEFPVPVQRIGRQLRVRRADLLEALHIPDNSTVSTPAAAPFAQLFGEPVGV